MSIKGRPGSWLRGALESGSLATAISEAADLPGLNLSDSLAIVLLMGDQDDRLFDRAAAKWVARLAIERRLGIEEMRVVLEAVRALPYLPEHARSCLLELSGRYRLVDVVGLNAEPRAPRGGATASGAR